ncbi:MAG: DUF4123 domain-containing protein [Planctomycetota bacterium]
MSSPYAMELQDELAGACEDEGLRLYALVDGAHDPGLVPRLRAAEDEAVCLYAGAPSELEAVGPWLVDLGDGGGALTTALLEELWGQGCVVPLLSAASLEELRKHFRGFLLVAREGGGKELYFRFYDPRILRVYLGTATPEELATVFGPVKAFVLEQRDPARALRCERDAAGALERAPLELAGAEA